MRGMNGSDVKRKNRGLLLKNIALGKGNSRIELATLTGLTKMTVGNIAQELISMGLVTENGPIYSGAAGPAPTMLRIAHSAKKIIGIYISRDALVFSLGELTGEIIFKKQVNLNNETTESITEKLITGVDAAMTYAGYKVIAIGVAMIGPIDDAGSIVDSPNFFNIARLPVKAILQEHFPYPVVIYNDISAAAVAEQLLGNGKYSDFVFIGTSNGLGAGIIHGGELLQSGNGFVGEFGHITVDINGPKCPCGNVGCLETYASVNRLIKRLSAICGLPVTPNEFQRLSANAECDAVFRDTADKLAAGMLTLTNLLRPEAFIIGYDGYFIPDKYLNYVEQYLNKLRFLKQGSPIAVHKAFFHSESAVYGSIACVLREIFNGEILFNN